MTESMKKVLKQRSYKEIERKCKKIHELGLDILLICSYGTKYPNISELKYVPKIDILFNTFMRRK